MHRNLSKKYFFIFNFFVYLLLIWNTDKKAFLIYFFTVFNILVYFLLCNKFVNWISFFLTSKTYLQLNFSVLCSAHLTACSTHCLVAKMVIIIIKIFCSRQRVASQSQLLLLAQWLLQLHSLSLSRRLSACLTHQTMTTTTTAKMMMMMMMATGPPGIPHSSCPVELQLPTPSSQVPSPNSKLPTVRKLRGDRFMSNVLTGAWRRLLQIIETGSNRFS